MAKLTVVVCPHLSSTEISVNSFLHASVLLRIESPSEAVTDLNSRGNIVSSITCNLENHLQDQSSGTTSIIVELHASTILYVIFPYQPLVVSQSTSIK